MARGRRPGPRPPPRAAPSAATALLQYPELALKLAVVLEHAVPAASALLENDSSVLLDARLASAMTDYVEALIEVADDALVKVLRDALRAVPLAEWQGRPVVEMWGAIEGRRLESRSPGESWSSRGR